MGLLFYRQKRGKTCREIKITIDFRQNDDYNRGVVKIYYEREKEKLI